MVCVQMCPRVHVRQWNAEVAQGKHGPGLSDICPQGLLTGSGTDPLQGQTAMAFLNSILFFNPFRFLDKSQSQDRELLCTSGQPL